MKNLFYIFVLFAFIASCNGSLRHKSELKQESGTVIAKQYQGEISDRATGIGMSTSGNMVFSSHSIHVNEMFNVVLKCEHGVLFTVNRLDLYEKVQEGDEVIIDYYEILNDKNEVMDLDFIDANLTTN